MISFVILINGGIQVYRLQYHYSLKLGYLLVGHFIL